MEMRANGPQLSSFYLSTSGRLHMGYEMEFSYDFQREVIRALGYSWGFSNGSTENTEFRVSYIIHTHINKS